MTRRIPPLTRSGSKYGTGGDQAAGDTWQPPPLVSHPLPVCVRVYARVAATSLCCCLCTHVCVFFKDLICIKYVKYLSQTVHECTPAAAVGEG